MLIKILDLLDNSDILLKGKLDFAKIYYKEIRKLFMLFDEIMDETIYILLKRANRIINTKF